MDTFEVKIVLFYDKKWPNGWKTAINVWNTIQKPLTINMIIGKEDIPIDYFRDNIGESLIDGQKNFIILSRNICIQVGVKIPNIY